MVRSNGEFNSVADVRQGCVEGDVEFEDTLFGVRCDHKSDVDGVL